MLFNSFTIVVALLFGFLLGSFLNVVIHRLPQTDAAGIRHHSKHTLFYLCWPMSFCPHCKTPILPLYNIPVISYLLLLGKSKCCQQPISWRYLLVECSGGLIGVLTLAYSHNWLDIIFIGSFLSLLLVASIIDWYRYYLLDILTLPLLWLGLLVNVDSRFALLSDAVFGAIGGYVGLATISVIFSFLMKKRPMGGGDYKLLAALGAWLGWQSLPILVFLACVFGLILAMMRLLTRRKKIRRIPFGPCLSLAGVLLLFYGDEIMIAYWQFILQ